MHTQTPEAAKKTHNIITRGFGLFVDWSLPQTTTIQSIQAAQPNHQTNPTQPTNQIKRLTPFSLLGPEPLGEAPLTASVFNATLKCRTIPIKNALLDQKIIAGLGNIYASEALWPLVTTTLDKYT